MGKVVHIKRGIVRDLHRVEHQIARKLDQVAAKNGLTLVQQIMLEYILEHSAKDAVFQKDIESAFDIRRSTVSNTTQLLEKKGYLVRTGVAGDGRLKRLTLTQEGETVCRKVKVEIEEVETSLLSSFTEGEQKQFFEMLDRLSGLVAEQEE